MPPEMRDEHLFEPVLADVITDAKHECAVGLLRRLEVWRDGWTKWRSIRALRARYEGVGTRDVARGG